ncbi:MAG: hypothetical protein QOJ39_262, partial [Candidatus Eremiobacteraeota bacterium]|nr:hypothetical protein [Candidatus Eremiobacteraeota bacterium]
AYRDVLTGRTVHTGAHDGRRTLELSDVFAVLPVAVLEPE